MERILTGLQPTGCITIGNYVGAIKQMVKNQDLYDSFLFIADMHAITVAQDPEVLRKNIKSLIAIYLACGIDPQKNTIYLQSENVYHANVSWFLECLTPYGELSRMTQFKDKSRKNQSFSAGLLTYPVLMAADILIYDADYVPVGKDQKQHVEFARNIASYVNKKYNKEIFKLPKPLIPEDCAKIGDLIDPTKKMSKSAENKKGVIMLLDEPEVIRKKIMGATTDSETIIKYDPVNKPGVSNLMTLYHVFTEMSMDDIEEHFKDSNYGTLKKEVADVIIEHVSKIQKKYYKLIDSDEIDKILDKGLETTLKLAENKYNELKNVMGLHR